MDDCGGNPVGLFLVSSGSKGDRLLFRYPYETGESSQETVKSYMKNPFSSRIPEDFQAYSNQRRTTSCIQKGLLVGYSDKTLANLMAVKTDLCDKLFELKVDDVLFVGYPTLIHSPKTQPSPKRELPTMISFTVGFALSANVSQSVVTCYYELAKLIAVALRHEERRCSYLSKQKSIMLGIQDEFAAKPEDCMESPFPQILQTSQLAQHTRIIYHDLCHSGVVIVRINNWIEVNYCMPFKIHNAVAKNVRIEPEAVSRCISSLRPYHGMLLLVDEGKLLDCLPADSSPALVRLIRVSSPLKSLQNLALDADLPLPQVFILVSHLVYWARAIIIFPLCENNVYVLSPHADTKLASPLVEKFTWEFPNMSLPAFLAEFSLPTPYGAHRDVLGLPQQQAMNVQILVWLLQHRLLMQLHTYVYMLYPSRYHQRGSSVTSDEDLSKMSSLSDKSSVTSVEGSPTMIAESQSFISSNQDSASSDSLISDEAVRAHLGQYGFLLSNLSPLQRRHVLAVPAANNMDDLKLFARLCRYFNGQHHLEDIMFYENVRRSQLLTLLDKFRSILLTCDHEDPATAFHVTSKNIKKSCPN